MSSRKLPRYLPLLVITGLLSCKGATTTISSKPQHSASATTPSYSTQMSKDGDGYSFNLLLPQDFNTRPGVPLTPALESAIAAMPDSQSLGGITCIPFSEPNAQTINARLVAILVRYTTPDPVTEKVDKSFFCKGDLSIKITKLFQSDAYTLTLLLLKADGSVIYQGETDKFVPRTSPTVNLNINEPKVGDATVDVSVLFPPAVIPPAASETGIRCVFKEKGACIIGHLNANSGTYNDYTSCESPAGAPCVVPIKIAASYRVSNGCGESNIVSVRPGFITDANVASCTPVPVVKTIAITGPTGAVAAGGEGFQFKATATLTDNTTKDVTQNVSWSTDAPTVALIGDLPENKGFAKLRKGAATINCSLGSIKCVAVTVDVTDPILMALRRDASDCTGVYPQYAGCFEAAQEPACAVAAPAVQAFVPGTAPRVFGDALGYYSDCSWKSVPVPPVVWNSSNKAVAEFSASNGKGLVPLQPGTTEVTASVIEGSRTVTSSPLSVEVHAKALIGIAMAGTFPVFAQPWTCGATPLPPDSPAGPYMKQLSVMAYYNDCSTANVTATSNQTTYEVIRPSVTVSSNVDSTGMLRYMNTSSIDQVVKVRAMFGGLSTQFLEVTAPTPNPVNDNDAKAYLSKLKAAYEVARPLLMQRFAIIGAVEPYAIQGQLPTLLSPGVYTATERTRYLNLQRYFAVISRFQATLSSGVVGPFFTDFADIIDAKTGNWSAAFTTFAASENLRLPSIMILRSIGVDPDLMTLEQRANDYPKFVKMTGSDPTAFFNTVLAQNAEKVPDLTRAMRKVKLTLRLKVPKSPFAIRQFIKSENVYDSGNPPDFTAAGFDNKVRGLSKWFFLTQPYSNCVLEPISTILSRISQHYNNESLFYIDDFYYGCESAGLDAPEKIAKILTAIRDKFPGAVLGFYAYLPRHDYWDALQPATSPDNIAWKAANEARRAAVADMVDVFMPSFYFPYTIPFSTHDKMTEWKASRTAIVAEAKRVAAASYDQPIVPFVFPVFYNTSYQTYCTGDVYKASIDHLVSLGVSAVIQYNELTAWLPSFNNPADGEISWYEALFIK